MSEYSEKLKDPRWQRLRLEVMQRDNFRCVECERGDRHLNVHHPRYKRGLAPWEYPALELVTLCEDCHETAHQLKDDVSFLIHRMKLRNAKCVMSALHRAARNQANPTPLSLLQAAVCEEVGDRLTDRILLRLPAGFDRREAAAIHRAIASLKE